MVATAHLRGWDLVTLTGLATAYLCGMKPEAVRGSSVLSQYASRGNLIWALLTGFSRDNF